MRTWDYRAILDLKYIRRKERDRRRRLENMLSDVFITKEEDNI